MLRKAISLFRMGSKHTCAFYYAKAIFVTIIFITIKYTSHEFVECRYY